MEKNPLLILLSRTKWRNSNTIPLALKRTPQKMGFQRMMGMKLLNMVLSKEIKWIKLLTNKMSPNNKIKILKAMRVLRAKSLPLLMKQT
jgi:hypothetical protein